MSASQYLPAAQEITPSLPVSGNGLSLLRGAGVDSPHCVSAFDWCWGSPGPVRLDSQNFRRLLRGSGNCVPYLGDGPGDPRMWDNCDPCLGHLGLAPFGVPNLCCVSGLGLTVPVATLPSPSDRTQPIFHLLSSFFRLLFRLLFGLPTASQEKYPGQGHQIVAVTGNQQLRTLLSFKTLLL